MIIDLPRRSYTSLFKVAKKPSGKHLVFGCSSFGDGMRTSRSELQRSKIKCVVLCCLRFGDGRRFSPSDVVRLNDGPEVSGTTDHNLSSVPNYDASLGSFKTETNRPYPA